MKVEWPVVVFASGDPVCWEVGVINYSFLPSNINHAMVCHYLVTRVWIGLYF